MRQHETKKWFAVTGYMLFSKANGKAAATNKLNAA